MSEKERNEYLIGLKKLRKKLVENPAAARKFLVDAGIYTPKGNLRKPYRNLCIPRDPA